MKYRVTTETGSTYIIDNDSLTWKREGKTDKSGVIRDEEGRMKEPVEIEIGKPMLIFTIRNLGTEAEYVGCVMTSPVFGYLEIQ